MNNEELKHYGIKGQKWGVRQYQNKDGSLTPAGKQRYGDKDNFEKQYPEDVKKNMKSTKSKVDKSKEVIDGAVKAKKKVEEQRHKQQIKKDLSEMSDQELRDIVNRLNMEERYTQIMQSRGVEQGKSRVDKILDYAGTALAIGSSALSIAIAIKELKG